MRWSLYLFTPSCSWNVYISSVHFECIMRKLPKCTKYLVVQSIDLHLHLYILVSAQLEPDIYLVFILCLNIRTKIQIYYWLCYYVFFSCVYFVTPISCACYTQWLRIEPRPDWRGKWLPFCSAVPLKYKDAEIESKWLREYWSQIGHCVWSVFLSRYTNRQSNNLVGEHFNPVERERSKR